MIFRRNCHVTDRILLSSQRRPAAGTVQRRLLRRGLYGHLGRYGLHLIGNKTISYTNVPNYKSDISPTLGLYKNKSTDFDHLLNAWFGFLPWDGFCREDYVDAFLTPGTKKRSDIRFMKDFTVEELKEIMPAGSIALIQHLQKDNVKNSVPPNVG